MGKRVYSCWGLQFTIKHFNAVQFFALVLKLQSFLAIPSIIPHVIQSAFWVMVLFQLTFLI